MFLMPLVILHTFQCLKIKNKKIKKKECAICILRDATKTKTNYMCEQAVRSSEAFRRKVHWKIMHSPRSENKGPGRDLVKFLGKLKIRPTQTHAS